MDYYEKKIIDSNATDIRAARKVFSRVGFAFFMLAGISALTQFAVMWYLKEAFPSGLHSSLLIYASVFLPVYLVATPFCILLLRRVKPRLVKQKSLTFGYFLGLLLMCIPIVYTSSSLGVFLADLIADNTGIDLSKSLSSLILGPDLLSNIIFIGLLAPIIEELLFRKLLIDRIINYGESIAVFTSALMFGLFQGNLTQFFYCFGIGLMFAYVYCKTGKIRYSIALHMIINTVGVVLGSFIISKIDLNTLLRFSIMEEGDPKTTALLEDIFPEVLLLVLYVGVLLILGIIGFILLIITRKRFDLEKAELPIPERKRTITVWMNFGMFLFIVECIGLFVYNTLLP